jgi:hypothetical protein
MARDWESTFRAWAKPSSDTEAAKSENAESMIRAAIRESDALKGRNIEVVAQGSYRNNTNVRQNSDVDICVRCMDVFFPDYSQVSSLSGESLGFKDASYSYSQFKNDVGTALVNKFGSSGVTRGSKAFDVHANSYRVDADVVACFEHRRYFRTNSQQLSYVSGTQFQPDRGGKIVNWPHQHYDNGVAKNKLTGSRFKYITRAIKRLRNEMAEGGIAAADPIPSYLIECLVWNAPDEAFSHEEYLANVRFVLAHTFNQTVRDENCHDWCEVSRLKWLFRSEQPWNRLQAHAFVAAAWTYVGFE